MKEIFEFKDIEPQLTEEQKTDLKHEIKLAMRDKKMQAVQIGEFGRKFCILTSGKMIFVPEENEDEKGIWVFNKEGFLSIAQNEWEKAKIEECLGVKPRKAKLLYLEKAIDEL